MSGFSGFDPGQGKSALARMIADGGPLDPFLTQIGAIVDILNMVDAVHQQQIIEFLAARYIIRCEGLEETAYAGICKHIGQMAGLRKTSARR